MKGRKDREDRKLGKERAGERECTTRQEGGYCRERWPARSFKCEMNKDF